MAKPQDKMPPGHKATVGDLETFCLPNEVEDTAEHIAMGKAMVKALQKTSIFQIQVTRKHQDMFEKCLTASRDFFSSSVEEKAKYVDDQSFSGYIASGEELTAGVADYSEIFTVTKDLPQTDSRVKAHWPCHGPCPWPNVAYKHSMLKFMELLKDSGDKLLQLTALGLGLSDLNTLKDLTQDGWHHMRNLRFPALNESNGKTKSGRGIGSHTDYGLLVIAAPDSTGGDFVRPRRERESIEEWQTSAAGSDEDDNDERWLFVPPIENTMTVFPGDMMQLLTNGVLAATPHKVALNTTERYAFAYFHEPNFNTVIETLPEFRTSVHYGSHFTKQFMTNYPGRITSKRIRDESRLDVLGEVRKKAISG